jgi:hypothetical protein
VGNQAASACLSKWARKTEKATNDRRTRPKNTNNYAMYSWGRHSPTRAHTRTHAHIHSRARAGMQACSGYMFVHARLHVRRDARIPGCTPTRICGCLDVRIHVFTYSRIHVFTYSRIHVLTYSRVHIFTCPRIHVFTYVHVRLLNCCSLIRMLTSYMHASCHARMPACAALRRACVAA